MLHQIYQSSNQNEISVAPGDQLEVHLDESPTTGYRWTPGMNSQIILSVWRDNQFMPPDAGIAGAGGKRVFHFNIVGTGSGIVSFSNQRKWSGDISKKYVIRAFISSACIK